jgi:HAD superfamily hydrolase (TIGR01509 family)
MPAASLWRPQGYIFDLDGVLIDSSKIQYGEWINVLRPYGKTLDYESFRRDHFGRRNNETALALLGEQRISPEEANRISDQIDLAFVRSVADHGVRVRGALDFIRNLRESGEKIALATSAPRQSVDAFLDAFSLKRLFDAEVCGDDVSRWKPDPEVFLKAASQLGENAADCVIFEDSQAGVFAAKAAGATCVALLTSASREILAGADFFIKDFQDKELGKIIPSKKKVRV